MKPQVQVRNAKTNEVRTVKVASLKTLEKDTFDGVSRCVGSCRCTIETDGICPNGWKSRVEVAFYA